MRVELDLDVQPDLLIEINETSRPPATSTVAVTTPEHSDEPAQPPRRRVPAARFTLPGVSAETTPLSMNWTSSFLDQKAAIKELLRRRDEARKQAGLSSYKSQEEREIDDELIKLYGFVRGAHGAAIPKGTEILPPPKKAETFTVDIGVTETELALQR